MTCVECTWRLDRATRARLYGGRSEESTKRVIWNRLDSHKRALRPRGTRMAMATFSPARRGSKKLFAGVVVLEPALASGTGHWYPISAARDRTPPALPEWPRRRAAAPTRRSAHRNR